ncbi:VTC domain-containing protein [Natranaerovirga hydrolytica]|uniref:VTC domain-containing protein n=1 Tax=Natranaerovirga hydrolytica TaxID=680378 RepID=A0A4R1MTV0_9FIRM|nr:polyphosphate polymerase domain-containing protein [Natranaerovirga hydrolytica]TCK93403.1 VTC domain-containing protein [Natranaerovirga hydrolytica]
MAKEIFNRYELKFLINEEVYAELINELEPYMVKDSYGDQDGYYTISNIYYDTEDNLFNYEKLKRQPFRQKVRLRTYNIPSLDCPSFLEIKKKHNGVVNKRRTVMALNEAYDFLNNDYKNEDIIKFNTSNHQILKEVLFLKNFYKLVPKVSLSYERQAFHAKEDKDLRITFDKNIRRRLENLRLEYGSEGEVYIRPDVFVFEIKVSEKLPLWLVKILSKYRCWMQSFSKYSTSQSGTDIISIPKKII